MQSKLSTRYAVLTQLFVHPLMSLHRIGCKKLHIQYYLTLISHDTKWCIVSCMHFVLALTVLKVLARYTGWFLVWSIAASNTCSVHVHPTESCFNFLTNISVLAYSHLKRVEINLNWIYQCTYERLYIALVRNRIERKSTSSVA